MAQVKLYAVQRASQSVGMRLGYLPEPHQDNDCENRPNNRWHGCKPLEVVSQIFGSEIQEIQSIYKGMDDRIMRALRVSTIEI